MYEIFCFVLAAFKRRGKSKRVRPHTTEKEHPISPQLDRGQTQIILPRLTGPAPPPTVQRIRIPPLMLPALAPKKKGVRHCSTCGQPGHNKTTCTKTAPLVVAHSLGSTTSSRKPPPSRRMAAGHHTRSHNQGAGCPACHISHGTRLRCPACLLKWHPQCASFQGDPELCRHCSAFIRAGIGYTFIFSEQ